jgi:dTDP-4-amino-4,6-dideoxygalactose transaminase
VIPTPLADPHGTFAAERGRLLEAFMTVLDSGSYILGDQVAAFEHEWASFCSCAHAVGMSSGTDALALSLRAVGVGPQDEVLVPAMTALATWMAVAQIGARPVGVDIDPERCAIDPDLTAQAVGSRTRAIVAVHLFGQPADTPRLASVASAAGVPLIEDAAQAHGASVGGVRVGSHGAAAAFSFYPTKNLGTMGDAGAVTTSSAELAERLRRLRQYGWRTRDDAEIAGVNARLDELHAALLRVLLPGLEAATRRRAEIADAYIEGLGDVSELVLPTRVDGTEPVWHLFVVRHPRRQRLAAELAAAGVATAVHYAPAPPLNRVFRAEGWREGDFPIAERHAATALSLPMHPHLSDEQVQAVIARTKAVCERV